MGIGERLGFGEREQTTVAIENPMLYGVGKMTVG